MPFPGGASSSGAAASPILRYDVEVRPSMSEVSLEGLARLELNGAWQGWPMRLPRHELMVETIRADGALIPDAGGEFILVPRSWVVEIAYSVRPTKGLVHRGGVIFTEFDTSYWMPCLEAPSVRAPIALTVVVPKGLEVAAVGEWVGNFAAASRGPGPPLVAWRYELAAPYPSYLYGFVLGHFVRASTVSRSGARVVVLAAEVEPARLAYLLKETIRMMEFLSDRAGVAYSLPSYVEVVVPGDAAQEMAGLSVLGREALEDMLRAPPPDSPVEEWLPVHELSHAWWGSWITCASWEEIWLNEGFAVFMTAAWNEERWGRAAYEVEMERARQRWRRSQTKGHDEPLAHGGTHRAITYSKAAVFLDALRRQLGERAFWAGLKAYTRRHQGTSVTSQNFQAAMSRAAGRNLEGIFEAWVDGPRAATSSAGRAARELGRYEAGEMDPRNRGAACRSSK